MARRLLSLAAIVAGSLLAALVLAELALRAIGFAAPVWYEPDPLVGWTLRPNVAAWFTREGRALVRVNASGRRDREVMLDKPDDVYRIAVLGDSYSEAMQVERDEAYWAQLPGKLKACGFQPHKKIEVLNFGVSGYGTAQEYLVLASKAMPYRPDLVLLQFTNGNDVKDNSFALDETKYRPFFMLDASGRLRIDDSFASAQSFRRSASLTRAVLRRLSDDSRVLQLLREVKKQPLMQEAHADDGAELGIEQGLEAVVLAPPKDRLWSEAWTITEALIAMIADHARRNGARFMLFSVPYAIQVHPDPKVRAGLKAKLGVDDLLYPDQRLAELGKRNGLAVLPLAPQMQRLAEKSGTFYHGFDNVGLGRGHWNPAGHRVAAELIAQHICSQSW